jgi:hypothetical protein
MNLHKVSLAALKSAPWRFSENRAIPHDTRREYTPILENIIHSLEQNGQIAPIHVRSLSTGKPATDAVLPVYEILDGHIVVDAARQIGMTELWALIHNDITTDEEARLRYIHFNLNRCGQYGHYHVKIFRTFGKVDGDTPSKKAGLLRTITSWPNERLVAYTELSEHDTNWKKFMFLPKEGEDTQQGFGFEVEQVVEDNQ